MPDGAGSSRTVWLREMVNGMPTISNGGTRHSPLPHRKVHGSVVLYKRRGTRPKRITVIRSPRSHSEPMTPEKAAIAKKLLDEGWLQHDIAAYLEVNQGRISEISRGYIFPDVEPSTQLKLFDD